MSKATMQAVRLIEPFLPHFSLATNAWSIFPYAWLANAPGYNTDFLPVSGVSANSVKWFIEATDRQPNDPVIIYLHGGAYSLGIFPTMAAMLMDIWRKVGNRRLSILWLDYTLTDKAKFPQQLKETVLVYNKLQQSCDNIILLGDSAGGHLILNLVRHSKHEAVDNVPILEGTEKLKTVMLISPGVNIESWGQGLVPDSQVRGSPSLNPNKDNIDWASILPPNVFISYGEQEASKETIENWVKMTGIQAEIFMEPKGNHDSLAISASRSQVMKPVVGFLKRIIGSDKR